LLKASKDKVVSNILTPYYHTNLNKTEKLYPWKQVKAEPKFPSALASHLRDPWEQLTI